MISFSPVENIRALRKRLSTLNPAFEDFEVDELTFYPSVEERLKRFKISYIIGHSPKTYLLSRYKLYLSLDEKYGSVVHSYKDMTLYRSLE